MTSDRHGAGAGLGVDLASTSKRRLPRVHVILEIRKALPLRLGKIAASARGVDRGPRQCELRNVAGTIGKDRARLYAQDHLGADCMREQRVVAVGRSSAVDAQPPRLLVQVDEQQ